VNVTVAPVLNRMFDCGTIPWGVMASNGLKRESDHDNDETEGFVIYYAYSQQTLRVVGAMANAMRQRGCDVNQAEIEIVDPCYVDLFSHFQFKHAYLAVARMVSPQLRRPDRFACQTSCRKAVTTSFALLRLRGG
jgi:hypothetical protein